MAQTFELGELLLASMNAFMNGVFTAMPGIVVSYDSEKQVADVQPAIKNSYTTEDDRQVEEKYPVIPNVPVDFPGCGRYSVTFPIEKGDTVLLVFMNCSIDRWISEGGVVSPGDMRRFCLSEAVAIPGLRSQRNRLRNVATDALTLGAPKICLGDSDASDGVARKSDLQALVTGFNTRIGVLTAENDALASGLPGTASQIAANQDEMSKLQAFLDALPPGWPACSTVTFTK